MLRSYLKAALHNLGKHRLSGFINIFGLALGIALLTVSYRTADPVRSLRAE